MTLSMNSFFRFQMRMLFAIVLVVATRGVSFDIDISKPIWEVDSRFLSVGIDSHVIAEKWKNFDFHAIRVISMARALSPLYLRLGGTAADLLHFKEKSQSNNEEHPVSLCKSDPNCWCATELDGQYSCEKWKDFYKKRTNFTMSGLDWIKVNRFVETVGWKLLFDLNALLRDSKGNWNSSNAEELFRFTTKLRYTNIAWELGNEPNAFHHVFNVTISGEQLGKDFVGLKQLLLKNVPLKDSLLVGPDVNQIRRCTDQFQDSFNKKRKKLCKPLKYLNDVMKNADEVLDAITWHHYYLNGHTAGLEDFLKIETLENLQNQMTAMDKFFREYGFKRPRLWLGETSSAFGGGAKGLSDRYVAGFLWLDKLGVAAVNRYDVVIRQSFYHGCYALIGEDLMPNPDFWISVLHKKLVGQRVLHVSHHHDNVRLYSHCSKSRSDNSGSVTLFGMNISQEKITLQVPAYLRQSSSIAHFILSSKKGLRSREILLNGRQLRLVVGRVPKLMPRLTSYQQEIIMQPYEMAFWVFNDANVKACK